MKKITANKSNHKKKKRKNLVSTKSYFVKNYLTYMTLILGSFCLMGAIFISQIALYSLNEKSISLSYSVQRAKELTEIIHSTEVSRYSTIAQLYSVNMMQIAEEANSTLLVSDLDGDIVFYYDPNNPEIQQTKIEPSTINQLLFERTYSEIGDLQGFFDSITYVFSTITIGSTGLPELVVIMGMPSYSTISLIIDMTKIFLIILFAMFILILIVTYFITSKFTSPLKNITTASKKFSTGDFSVRVVEDTGYEEIDVLSKSINNMASELARSERHRTTFIENVSHELKTPMTSIGGFIDGILDGTIPQDRHEHYLQIISDEVHRLSRLTTRMLQTSKIHDENFTITLLPFNFTEIISRIIISFESKILSNNLDIHVDFPEDDVIAIGDRDNIYQVVYNLIDNAVKFTQNGKLLKITLSTSNGYAYFSCQNMGDTISPEKLPNLFNRFYKVDSSRSEDTTGAGLGLYLVKKIIMLHDSSIQVTSENGLTTFKFALKLQNNK